MLCEDGSIDPLNLQRTINSGGGEWGWTNGLHHVGPFAVRANNPLVVLGGGMCGFPWYMYM